VKPGTAVLVVGCPADRSLLSVWLPNRTGLLKRMSVRLLLCSESGGGWRKARQSGFIC